VICSPRTAGCASTTNSSTRSKSSATCSGGARSAGSVGGVALVVPAGPVCRVILRAVSAAALSPTQALSPGRQCHCTPVAVMSSISNHFCPPAQGRRRLSACQAGPARLPLKPCTCTCGRRCISQALPASVASSQRRPPARPPSSSSSKATMASSGSSRPRPVRTGVAGACSAAGTAACGAGGGGAGVCSSAMVVQSAMPTLKCTRSFCVSRPQARSMRSGPTGLRQRRPAP